MHDEYFIGDPAAQMDDWIYQDHGDNCAVAAETTLINQFLDHSVTLDETNYISSSNGWWHPGSGTNPEDIGNLMDTYGIDNHTVVGASVEQLVAELQQGHGVIVGVNSSELWDQGVLIDIKQFFYDAFGLDTADFNPADHAVVVTGIDMSDPDHPMAILNDSGSPNGAAARYPLDQFLDAWENGHFYYTATDNPIPESPYASPDAQGLDLADILGLATTLATDSPIAGTLVSAGVDFLTESDWDAILTTA